MAQGGRSYWMVVIKHLGLRKPPLELPAPDDCAILRAQYKKCCLRHLLFENDEVTELKDRERQLRLKHQKRCFENYCVSWIESPQIPHVLSVSFRLRQDSATGQFHIRGCYVDDRAEPTLDQVRAVWRVHPWQIMAYNSNKYLLRHVEAYVMSRESDMTSIAIGLPFQYSLIQQE